MNQTPVLYIREGELAGKSFPIEADMVVIGRGSDCGLTLPERQVSRHHVEIHRRGSTYWVKDLGSKNGTHLNGNAVIGEDELHDGDELQIALAVKMVFIGTDATVPIEFEMPALLKPSRLQLDEDKRIVITVDGELNPPLSLAQFRLLKALYDADGAVCDRDMIIGAVWPGTGGYGVSEQAVDALVRRLRDRLSEIDDHNYVVTVRGHGFRLDNSLDEE